MSTLTAALVASATPQFCVLIEPEVIIDAAFPPTIRVPDIVVCDAAVDGQTLAASNVLLAIEIVSPGSRRTDHVTKRSEYADAGIPHYWIIDLEPDGPALTALTLTDGVYVGETVRGTFECTTPFTFRLDLGTLAGPR